MFPDLTYLSYKESFYSFVNGLYGDKASMSVDKSLGYSEARNFKTVIFWPLIFTDVFSEFFLKSSDLKK